MQDFSHWPPPLRPLLAPPAALSSLAMRLREALHAKKILRAWTPPAPTVCVGGINSQAGGKVLVSAWLLGWAEARGLNPALLAEPGDASSLDMPCAVKPGSPARECGLDAALLARYRPGAAILADDRPARAGKSAWNSLRPGVFILHDLFSALSLGRGANIVLLDPHDLDRGWNRPFPAGSWREGASALGRASAFILHAWPDDIPMRKPLAERRLAHFGKPLFTVHPRIWRLRNSAGETATDLGGEPYLLVSAESGQAVAAKAAQAFLGLAPRLSVVFPDSHRFTQQDLAQIGADAARMRAPHVLATPKAALLMGGVPGRTLWTYDPDVVLGPCLLDNTAFTPWWDSAWASLSAAP